MNNDNLLPAAFTLALGVFSLAGCATSANVKSPPSLPSPMPPAAAVVSVAEQRVLEGKVVETMTSGGLTYVLLEKDGVKAWSAIPITKVSVGDDVVVSEGFDMGKFTSTTLGRSFKNIHFSYGSKVTPANPAANPAAGSQAPAPQTDHPAQPGREIAPVAPAEAKQAAQPRP